MASSPHSHQLPAAAGDAPHPAPFSHLGVLDVPSSTSPRPSGRKHNWAQPLAALATKPGEICGLGAETRVGVRVGTIGGSSFTLEYLVEADGVTVAEAITTQVIVDRKSGRPMRMEAGMRAKLEAHRGSGEE